LVLLLGEVALGTPDESLAFVSLKPRSAVAMEVEVTTLALTLSDPAVRRSCVFLCAACPDAARSLVPHIEATRECVTPDREIGIDLALALVIGTSVDALVGDASRVIAELDSGTTPWGRSFTRGGRPPRVGAHGVVTPTSIVVVGRYRPGRGRR
jgi:hypothetical protein